MFVTELQKILRSGITPEQLKETLGINYTEHPTLPLCAFKYDQINSPKFNPVVMASRGTVLEKGTWNLVAQPFFRFFNYGESLDITKNFNFDNFVAMHKEDGSLAIVYYYAGEWHMNTSGTFGLGECGFSRKTWRELFWETAKINTNLLNPKITYIFELCTVHNKVVRIYSEPVVFLIGMIVPSTGEDISVETVYATAEKLGVRPIQTQRCHSYKDIETFLTKVESTDPTFEGLVLRDCNNLRLKIKTKTYLRFHNLLDNGNILHPRNIITFLLNGESDEVLTYFPELKQKVEEIDILLSEEFNKLKDLWGCVKDIEDQKEFALAIIGKTKFTNILFTIRKTGEDLKQYWRKSPEIIYKALYQ